MADYSIIGNRARDKFNSRTLLGRCVILSYVSRRCQKPRITALRSSLCIISRRSSSNNMKVKSDFYETFFRSEGLPYGLSRDGQFFSKISRFAKYDKRSARLCPERISRAADVEVSFQSCGTLCVSLCLYRRPLVDTALSKGARCSAAPVRPRARALERERTSRIHRAISVARRLALR